MSMRGFQKTPEDIWKQARKDNFVKKFLRTKMSITGEILAVVIQEVARRRVKGK